MNFFFLAYMICAGFLLLHDKIKKLYDPVAYALICTLLGLAVMQSAGMNVPKYQPVWGIEIWLPNFIAGFGLLYLLSHAVGGFKKQMDSQAIVIAVGVILLALFTNAGILLSIMLTVFGRMNHRRLVSFIGWISHLLLLSNGFQLGEKIIRPAWHSSHPECTRYQKGTKLMRIKLALLLLLPVLGYLNLGILSKESLKANGETILLELAPRDPRSLLQGDYMALNYRLHNELRGKKELRGHRGQIVIKKDDNGVATLDRIYNGEELAENERLLRFNFSGRRPEVATHSFFFQEGKAKAFEAAHYGIFKLDSDGSLLLVDLADENREPISPKAYAQ